MNKKLFLSSILAAALGGGALYAAPEMWTSKDGRKARMELLEVVEQDGETAGKFRMQGDRIVTIKASALDPDSAAKLSEKSAGSGKAGVGAKSVYDEFFADNLVKLEGKSFKPVKIDNPAKYFLFYHTASWCGPCQAFTPSLVDFYDKQHPKTNDFELVLVTSDRDEDAMLNYAKEKKMAWPQVKFSEARKFKGSFPHPGNGIPNLVLTDLEGNIIKSSYENGQYIGPRAVMDHLGKLLKQ